MWVPRWWQQVGTGGRSIEEPAALGHRHCSRAAAAKLCPFPGSLAFLLRTGAVPGWRQYGGHPAALPQRLLGPSAPRLPLVIHSVVQEGEVVCVRAAHYPALRRLADAYHR